MSGSSGSTLKMRPVLVSSLMSVVTTASVIAAMMIVSATLSAHAPVVIMMFAAHLSTLVLILLRLKICLRPELLVHLPRCHLRIWVESICVDVELILLLWVE